MSERNLLEGRNGPVSQSVDAVKALLQWKGRAVDPLPIDVSFDNGRLVLVLSNKKDAYYTCTSKACSCPASSYHPGQACKHRRHYFAQEQTVPTIQAGSLRPEGKWPGGLNGPVTTINGAI